VQYLIQINWDTNDENAVNAQFIASDLEYEVILMQ